MSPTVSVIIPTYNRAARITRAIESVTQQTYGPMEIVVCDDGSTDEHIVRSNFPEVRYLKLEHSGLPSRVRNEGIRVAQGELIAFLDSDDYWMPEKISLQVEAMGGKLGMSCSNAWRITPDDDRPGSPLLEAGRGSSGRVFRQLIRGNFVINSTVLVTRDLIDRVGGLNEDPALRGAEDYELWLRIGLHTDVAYLPQPLAYYLEHPQSITGLNPRCLYLRSVIAALNRSKEEAHILGHRGEYDIEFDERIWSIQSSLLEGLIRDRKYSEAARLSAEMLLVFPLQTTRLVMYIITHLERVQLTHVTPPS